MSSHVDHHRQALGADPEDVRAFDALQEHYFLQGEWPELVEVYRARLAAPSLASDPLARAELMFRMAQVLEERCNDLEAAEATYWDVARLAPQFRPALRQLRHIYESRSQWDMVLQTAELEDQTSMSPADRSAFMADLGEVWLEHLDDVDEACRCFEGALEADPHRQKALRGLARTHEKSGDHRKSAEMYERLVALLRGPERAPEFVALGKLYARSLDEAERATTCFRRAISDDPRNEEAVECLVAIAMAQEQWSLLADLYERRFDLGRGARQRAAIAVEAGTMQLERLENPEAARSWFERARELADDDPAVHYAIAALERAHGDARSRRDALDRVIALGEGTAPVSILVEAAGLHAEGGRSDLALRYLRDADARKPDDPRVVEALSRALSQSGEPADLADVLERRAALATDDPVGQAEALFELSRIQEQDLGDRAAALDALTRAFDANPANPQVTAGLARLYRKAERWPELRTVLERALQQSTGTERGRVATELGGVLADRLSDDTAARRAFEIALEVDPRDTDALAGLEQVARRTGDEETLLRVGETEASITTDPDRLAALASDLVPLLEARDAPDRALVLVQRVLESRPGQASALRAAARLQERLGLHAEQLETLTRLDATLEGPERASNRLAIAALQRTAGDTDGAIASLEMAVECDPSDVVTLRTLIDHYQAAERLPDVARVQRRLVDAVPANERAAALSSLATLLEVQLADADGAIVVLWRLVELPDHPADAVERLESLLERAGRFEDLAQQLAERRRRLPEDDPACRALDLRRARLLLDQLGQLEDAAALYRAIWKRDPECLEAVQGLEEALRASHDSSGLAALLEHRAREERDPGARARLELERAVLLEESIGDEEAALTLFGRLAESAADASVTTVANERIERLLERRGDWETLRRRIESRLRDASGADALDIHARLAAICRDRLADHDGCIVHLEAVGAIDPSRTSVWCDLGQLYEEQDRTDDVLRVMGAELDTEPEPARCLVLHARTARIHAGRATDSAADLARDHYEQVLALDATHSEASEYLIDVYTTEGRTDDVAQLLDDRLAALATGGNESSAERLELELRLATLRAEELGDRFGAIRLLEGALERGVSLPAVATPLAKLYEDEGHDESLIPLCRRAGEDADSAAERAAWTVRLAKALARTGQFREAADAYCQVLVDRPGDRDVEAALRDLYRELDEPGALAALLETEIPRVEPDDRVAMRIELAELLAERLDRPEEALDHLREVVAADRGHDEAFQLALNLSEELGRQDDILVLIDQRLDATPPGAERARLLERRGDLLAVALDRPEEAASAYREAVALAPDPRSARQSLRIVMERLRRWPAVLDCLHLEAQAAEPGERVEILEKAIEIARDHVSMDATLPWLERLRADRPEDPTVVAQMADVHRQAGRPEALLRAIEHESALEIDDARRRDLEISRARILERDLGATGRAVQALESARELAPDDLEVLTQLDRLYDLMGRTGERVDVIERRIALEPVDDRIELHRQAAVLHASALSDPDRGIAHLLQALALCGDDRSGAAQHGVLLAELTEILRHGGRHDAWARAAEQQLATLDPSSASDRQRAAELHLELGGTYDRELGLPDTAMRHVRSLLEMLEEGDEQDTPVQLPGEAIERAEQLLIDRLRSTRCHSELAERLATRLVRGAGGSEEWLELARIRSEQLHVPAAAGDAYREVLARKPGHLAAIRGLRHTAEMLCDWTEVARTLELELTAPERWSPHQLAALHHRLGDVCRHRLGALERAADAYAAALDARPDELAVLHALQTLQEQRGLIPEAIDLFEREIELLGAGEPQRRRALWLRVAKCSRDELDDSRRALRGFTEASTIEALGPEDQRALAELHRADGNVALYAEAFAIWCDEPTANATVWDHLALASAHRELGDAEAALTRARRAVEIAPENGEAWDVIAALLEAAGDRREAAEALERSADLHVAKEAAVRLVSAAGLVDSRDHETVARLLRRALDEDPGLAPAHAALSVVAEQLDEPAEAAQAAARAIDLAEFGEGLDRETRLECALVGGRCARANEDLESASRFLSVALELDPRHREALDAACDVAFELGEYGEARRLASERLELGGEDPDRARRTAIVARGLELEGDASSAVARYREALEREPGLGIAHEGLVRLHEESGDASRVLGALESWIEHDDDGTHRAALRVRAAELLREAGRTDDAERQLRGAVRDDPDREQGWTDLVMLLAESGREDQTLDEGARALAHVRSDAARSRVALARARILDAREELRPAAEAYGEAARRDVRCVEAALAQARLLRAMGDWNASAEAISQFLDHHPDPDCVELARVHLEWGRLASGPLEDVAQATRCYERALDLCPELVEAREPLAALLAHVPDRWRDAVESHRALLRENPARLASLRSLLEISRRRDIAGATALGLSLLKSLGCASPTEAKEAPSDLGVLLGGSHRMTDPVWEAARRICAAASGEIAEALAGSESGDDARPAEADGIEAVLRRHRDELTAPGLDRLDTASLESVLFTVTALATDPGGNCTDGPYRYALDESLGRWVRRKIRKTLGDLDVRDIQSIDYAAWRDELRVMSACAAIDTGEIDVRSALLALSSAENEGEPTPDEAADLTARVSAAPAARALLARAGNAWCEAIVGNWR